MNILSTEDRFWQYVAPITEERGCWEWTAHLFDAGYGGFAVTHSKKVGAHRFSYALHYGEIPAGLSVLHKCDNRSCVNPQHLFLGTQGDNVRDCVAKGRNRYGNTQHFAAAARRAKTHCRNGHPLDRVTVLKSGPSIGLTWRFCSICAHAAKMRYKRRQRAMR